MFGLVSEKAYLGLLDEATGAVEDNAKLELEVKTLRLELLSSQNGHRHALEDARSWRARAETAESSPEVKADTEAAFIRGQAHKQRTLGNWLMIEGQRLMAGDQD